MKKATSGFTIVELLIVIVVIAILAAITIVAYNGIQTRAKNTKTLVATEQAIKLLGSYKAINGAYPTGYSYACIGEYDSDVCQYSSPGAPEVTEQSSFKSAIASVGTMPQPSPEIYAKSGTRTGGGAYYRVSQQDVVYHLVGFGQSCDAGGSGVDAGQVTTCTYPLP